MSSFPGWNARRCTQESNLNFTHMSTISNIFHSDTHRVNFIPQIVQNTSINAPILRVQESGHSFITLPSPTSSFAASSPLSSNSLLPHSSKIFFLSYSPSCIPKIGLSSKLFSVLIFHLPFSLITLKGSSHLSPSEDIQ